MSDEPRSLDNSESENIKPEPLTNGDSARRRLNGKSRNQKHKRATQGDPSESGSQDVARVEVQSMDEEDEDELEQRGGRKKRRGLNGEAQAVDNLRDEPIEDYVSKAFVRDPADGYTEGSIVRICCENFLTYDFVQFSPGPRMNMILGPNGTGKSTIACAICIGLGFPVKTLGRADELNQFIKHGYKDAFVEIELKGKIGKPNLIVRRTISLDKKKNTWALNNKNANQAKVTEAVSALSIQINNLCSFLPQDRVNEFAKLKPDELLVETQKVAGHAQLSVWHEKLKERSVELREIKAELADKSQERETEEGKNARIERDVARFRERQRLEEDLALYKVLIPWYRWREDKIRSKDIRMRWKQAGARLKAALEVSNPVKTFKEELEAQHASVIETIKGKTNKIKALKNELRALSALNKTRDENCNTIQNKITKIKEDDKSLKDSIDRVLGEIHEYETKLQQLPALDNPESHRQEMIVLKKRVREMEQQRKALSESTEASNNELDQVQREGNYCEEEIKRLENITEQRYSLIRQPSNDPKLRHFYDENFWKVAEWVKNNQHEFSKPVPEPACFSVSVNDPRFAFAVESSISHVAAKMFVFECEEDYDKFNLFLDKRIWGQGVLAQSWYRPKSELESAETREQILSEGFDGYVLDYIEAPKLIKWYLSKQFNFHQIPVASDSKRVNLDRASALLTPRNSQPRRFITGHTLNILTRSSYGQRLLQNSTSNIEKPVFFTSQPVDMQKKDELNMRLEEAKTKYRQLTKEIKENGAKDRELFEQNSALAKQLDSVEEILRDIVKRSKERKRLETDLDAKKESLVHYQNTPSGEKKAEKLRTDLKNAVNERIALIPQYKNLIQRIQTELTNFTKASFESVQLEADIAAVAKIYESHVEKYTGLQREVLTLDTEFKALASELKHRKIRLEELVEALEPKVRERKLEYIAQHPDGVALDGLEREKAEIQSKLDLTTQVNSGIIKTYEDRKIKIEALKASVERLEHKKQHVDERIERIKSRWQPLLQALIDRINGRFSAAFDRIKCAGEVRIAENEDFSKWAIEILVKFRSNEPLQLLTGQRQSGGERSLTTILYLMSLTGLAKTPFALVDEINQGMDVKYERAVHNELIQVTCAEDSSQYFLITPKLLPNLTYHKNLTTLIINNGDWLPESRDDTGNINDYGDLGRQLAKYKASRTA